jgi:hypothetical protein
MTTPTEFFYWEVDVPGRRTPKRTSWRMTRADAAKWNPKARPVAWSRQLIDLPEHPAECQVTGATVHQVAAFRAHAEKKKAPDPLAGGDAVDC